MSEYTCQVCRHTYCERPGWTEEARLKEAAELFPDEDLTKEENRAVVCDDCHKDILEWIENGCPERENQSHI